MWYSFSICIFLVVIYFLSLFIQCPAHGRHNHIPRLNADAQYYIRRVPVNSSSKIDTKTFRFEHTGTFDGCWCIVAASTRQSEQGRAISHEKRHASANRRLQFHPGNLRNFAPPNIAEVTSYTWVWRSSPSPLCVAYKRSEFPIRFSIEKSFEEGAGCRRFLGRTSF